MSQIQNSPARGTRSSDINIPRDPQRTGEEVEDVVPSHKSKNPPIQLIPAISRKKPYF